MLSKIPCYATHGMPVYRELAPDGRAVLVGISNRPNSDNCNGNEIIEVTDLRRVGPWVERVVREAGRGSARVERVEQDSIVERENDSGPVSKATAGIPVQVFSLITWKVIRVKARRSTVQYAQILVLI